MTERYQYVWNLVLEGKKAARLDTVSVFSSLGFIKTFQTPAEQSPGLAKEKL